MLVTKEQMEEDLRVQQFKKSLAETEDQKKWFAQKNQNKITPRDLLNKASEAWDSVSVACAKAVKKISSQETAEIATIGKQSLVAAQEGINMGRDLLEKAGR